MGRIVRSRKLTADFWRLWTASVVSNVGDGVALAALPLLIAQVNRDPVAVAGVTVAASLPWLLFGLMAGAIADRVDRRRLMVVVDLARAAVLGLLAVAIGVGPLSPLVVYGAVFLLGIGETLFDTASQAVLPAFVGRDDLDRANGTLFGAQLAANGFVGPSLGGYLFGLAVLVPFLFDAATFAVSALMLLALRGAIRTPRAATTGIAADVREGLVFLWRHPVIRGFAIGAAVINLAYTGATSVLVLFAQDLLGVDDSGFGLLLTMLGIGGIAGTFVAAPLIRRIGRSGSVLAALGLLAVTLAAAGLSSRAWVAGVGLALNALASEVWNVVAVSYRQAEVPAELLGRTMAGYRVVAYGSLPIGAALGGTLAGHLGLRAPFLLGALLVAALVPYLFRLLSEADLYPHRTGSAATRESHE